jgi:hypothetical protein
MTRTAEPDTLATAGLECLVDDEEDPAEVTVFSPEAERMTTEWITADIDDTVPRRGWL